MSPDVGRRRWACPRLVRIEIAVATIISVLALATALDLMRAAPTASDIDLSQSIVSEVENLTSANAAGATDFGATGVRNLPFGAIMQAIRRRLHPSART